MDITKFVRRGSNFEKVFFSFFFPFLIYEGMEDAAGHHRPARGTLFSPEERDLNGVSQACR